METIKKAIRAFIAPGATAELRIIDAQGSNEYTANYTGFFDNVDKMAEAAAKFSGKAPAVYFTIQQCKPEVLARAENRMKKAAGKKGISTSDHEIEKYNWLPIDLDAKRMRGISATDAEHAAAMERARVIFKFLTGKGWPMPIVGDSGNGAHVCFKIDLQNTDENKAIVQNCILALGQKFSDDVIEIDRTVFNPSRIWKLYGTKTMKGDATADRPHRMAKIVLLPDEIKQVTLEQLKELAAMVAADVKPEKGNVKSAVTNNNASNEGGIDVVSWCNKYQLEIGSISDWKDAVKYQLLPCPFNSDHSEALILKQPSGAVAFKCSHNGCSGKTWQDLRAKFEPVKDQPKERDYPENSYNKPQKSEKHKKIDPRIDVERDLIEMQEELNGQRSGEKVTIPMPWGRLSDLSDAFRPGTLTILAGPSKKGKSFFAQNIVKHVHELGYPWAYLPLEDRRQQWMWRQLAILQGDYQMIRTDQAGYNYRQAVYDKFNGQIREYLGNVSENPRAGHRDHNNATIIPEVPHKVIVDWVREQAKTKRFIIVDPVSQIDSEGKETWKEESWFMRQILGVIADASATLLLITHTVKRSGMSGKIDITAEDVQGSSMFVRLAQTTLLLDGLPDYKEGMVCLRSGEKTIVKYDKVVTIAAARNGPGTGLRIAFNMNKQHPSFEELGILVPNKKGE